MKNLQYVQENFITDTILKWRLKDMMKFFNRGDFGCHYSNPISINFWIKNNIGKITPKKIDLIKKYAPELLKYVT